jgi:hypothetical protein
VRARRSVWYLLIPAGVSALAIAPAALPVQAHAAGKAGIITTMAGTGGSGDSGDGGPAVHAGVALPSGVVADSPGDVYVLDDFGSRVRKITPAGVISTIAGGGSSTANGIPATKASISASAISVDRNGNVLIADEFHYKIRRIDHSTGLIKTIAGTGTKGESGDGGAATSAELQSLSAITTDSANNVYFADDNRVRVIDAATGRITTVAGTGSVDGAMGDGGPATAASIPVITGLAVNSKKDIYIGSLGCSCVRKVTHSTGVISIVVNANALTDTPATTPAQRTDIEGPEQLALDSAGGVYITGGEISSNFVGRLDPTDTTFTVVAGTGAAGYSGDGGPATAAKMYNPQAVAVTPTGDLIIADWGNDRVRIVYGVALGPAFAPGVTAISAAPVTSGTPLYRIPVVLSLAGGSCPASVSVVLGGLPAQPEPVCGPGGHVPAKLTVFLTPWVRSQQLTPGQRVTVSAGGRTAALTLPARPIWVAVGDSYSSGHNQKTSHWNFLVCGSIPNNTNKCGLTWNDPAFAWATIAAHKINAAFGVPSQWQMKADIVGRSGASSASYASGQVPAMKKDLASAPGTWNVVSTTGGANTGGKGHTFTFSDAVQGWYEAAIAQGYLRKGVWTANLLGPGCPNTEKVYQTAQAERGAITSDLANVLAAAWQEDRSVRLVDVNYPYVMPKSAACAKGGGLDSYKHGSTAVINMLASAHDAVPAKVRSLTSPGVNVLEVDLRDPRSPFGSVSDPRSLLQLTAFYGYPHPNATGQQDIATMAVAALTGG